MKEDPTVNPEQLTLNTRIWRRKRLRAQLKTVPNNRPRQITRDARGISWKAKP